MRPIARFGLGVLTSMTLAALALSASAQTSPATKGAAAPPSAAVLNQPLATVNGEPITRGDLIRFLSNYQIPADSQEQIYNDAIETLINTRLINQYLNRQRIPVSEQKVDESIANLEKSVKQEGGNLQAELQQSGMSMADLRKEYANRIRWIDFLNSKATDAELKKFNDSHKELFNGTQVKASHILLKVEPRASAAEKEKIRQKLVGLKKDIEANKTTFAEAANKHSEDPANAEGAGGDIGYFTLSSGLIDEFATAAFAMKKGAISDPVETPYGYHLIHVTDRKEGTPFDFEQNKVAVKQLYAVDLQKNLLAAERKTAKIDIKPMPTDLFPPAPAAPATPAPAPGATKGAAATKGAVPK